MLKKLAEEADKIKCDKKARAAVLAEENIQHKIEASLEQQRLLQKSIRQKRG